MISNNNYDRCILNITRSIDRIIGDRVPYSHFSQGTNIAELDAIIYEPTGDIAVVDYYHPFDSCQLHIVCQSCVAYFIRYVCVLSYRTYSSFAALLYTPYLTKITWNSSYRDCQLF